MARTAKTTPAGDERRIIGPDALKGLAHPLRVRLLSELTERGRATASQLAEALGESSGATSYHLRQLHRHGFIVDDPTGGTGRERYWRTIPEGWELPLLDLADDAGSGHAAGIVMREQLVAESRQALRTLQQAKSWPQPWRESLRRQTTRLELTPEQVHDLHAELDAVINKYRAMPAREGARRVMLAVNTTPTEHPGLNQDGH